MLLLDVSTFARKELIVIFSHSMLYLCQIVMDRYATLDVEKTFKFQIITKDHKELLVPRPHCLNLMLNKLYLSNYFQRPIGSPKTFFSLKLLDVSIKTLYMLHT